MRKRAVVLAGLLVLVLGTGVVAQEPSPSPGYAPDDLASLLPRQVGSLTLAVEDVDTAAALADDTAFDAWQDFLMPLGKDLSDVRMAIASADVEPDEWGLVVTAIRVDGVPASDQVDELVLPLLGVDIIDLPAGTNAGWQEVDGRLVLTITGDDHDNWVLVYPKGEVMFFAFPWVGQTASVESEIAVTIEDVLAELP